MLLYIEYRVGSGLVTAVATAVVPSILFPIFNLPHVMSPLVYFVRKEWSHGGEFGPVPVPTIYRYLLYFILVVMEYPGNFSSSPLSPFTGFPHAASSSGKSKRYYYSRPVLGSPPKPGIFFPTRLSLQFLPF